MTCPDGLALGSRVLLVEAGDIRGVVVDRTEYLDGSIRFGVEYWHGGERQTINCTARELRVVDPQPAEVAP